MLNIVADEMDGIALFAMGEGVCGEEVLPMPALFAIQRAGSLAERAILTESRKDGPADEFRLVGDPIQPVCHFLIGFKGDDALAIFAHYCPPAVHW
jgi:hypothetical protein